MTRYDARPMKRPAVCVALALLAAACGSVAPSAPDAGKDAGPPALDYLVIAADSLAASAGRWRDWRATDHKVELVTTTKATNGASTQADATAAIRAFVKARFDARDPSKPFFVLLVGDADGNKVSADTVPVATYAWAEGPVTNDNAYADMDDDGVPDLAIGRIPARTDEEVDRVRAKIAAYESTYAVGPHARRMNIFASTSGFGEPADSLIEALVFKVVEEIPYDYDITMTYAKQASPYVFVPERFSDKVYDRIDEGALLVTYVGHGYQQGFATLDWNGAQFQIMDTSKLSKITAAPKEPILTLIACATGAFDEGDSVSEQILRGATGPVAVLSSTENSDPYPNAIFVRELSQVVTVQRAPTIGQAFMAAKDRMIHQDDALRQTMDKQVGLFVDAPTRAAQKQSHLYMYTLFGDPAMRIGYPGAGMKLGAPAQVAPGAMLQVSVSGAPATGKVAFTLETARSAIRGAIQQVPMDGDPQRDAVIEANYAAANQKVVATATAMISGGNAAAAFMVPADLAAGDYHVKAYADDGARDAVGSANVHVAP